MKRSDPRYQMAFAWARRLARQNRGVEAIAVIGDYHLSVIIDKLGQQSVRSWYSWPFLGRMVWSADLNRFTKKEEA